MSSFSIRELQCNPNEAVGVICIVDNKTGKQVLYTE